MGALVRATRFDGATGGSFSNCDFRERRVCLENGVGGVIEGVGTHQVSCVALELFF